MCHLFKDCTIEGWIGPECPTYTIGLNDLVFSVSGSLSIMFTIFNSHVVYSRTEGFDWLYKGLDL
jgi:hypothetical protein